MLTKEKLIFDRISTMKFRRLFIGIITVYFYMSGYLLSAQELEPKNFDEKNEVLSFVAKNVLDFYLKEHGYGELKEFSINNKAKKFFFKTKLKGEERFLSVAVNRYDIVKEGNKYFFVAKDIATDREWLNNAAKDFLEERKIEVPAKYSLFLLAAM